MTVSPRASSALLRRLPTNPAAPVRNTFMPHKRIDREGMFNDQALLVIVFPMPKPDLDYDPTEGETTFHGVVLPAIMLGVGLIVRLAFAFFRSSSASEHIGLMICQVILSVMVMLIACVTASMLMSVNFGPIDRAALKL